MKLLRWCCALLTLLAGGFVVAIAIRGSARPIVLNQSLASGAMLLVALAVTGLFLLGAFLPDPSWRSLMGVAAQWRSFQLERDRTRWFVPVLVVLLLCQGAILWRLVGANVQAVDDQADYLRVAREIRELGGSGYVVDLFSGRFLEDNRHPIYCVLLACHPSFTLGKYLSAFFGMLVTLVAALFAESRFGATAGVLTAALLAVNGALAASSSLVACESLLTLLVTFAWMQLCWGGMRTPHGAMGIGATFGLGYLTKASAFFPLVITFLHALVVGDRGLARRLVPASLLVVGFVVISLPLLVRNIRAYGSPLHSFNTKLLFADSFDEGRAEPDLGTINNARHYWSRHGAGGTLRRLGEGLVVEGFVLVRSLGPVPLESARAIPGSFLFAIAIVTMLVDREGGLRGRLLFWWLLFFWGFFGWYLPIATSDRFTVPLVPALLVAASWGVVRGVRVFLEERMTQRIALVGAVAYGLLFAMWTIVG
ncbi:hypothetical protein [Planctomycetes bacterium Pan216]|uniref:hypothetical protein n=1 Tax=Kolteria novifilia TaxID=2527975 RepID=UPI0011A5C562